jgi:hypothetical protein
VQNGAPQSKEAWLAYQTREAAWNLEQYAQAKRPPMPTQAPEKRVRNFGEIELGFKEEVACEEARRCLRCDLEREREMAAAVKEAAEAAEAKEAIEV